MHSWKSPNLSRLPFFFVVSYVAVLDFVSEFGVLSFSTTNSLRWSCDRTLVHQHAQAVPPIDTCTDISLLKSYPLNRKGMRSLAGPYLIESIEDLSTGTLNDASSFNERGACTVSWALFPLDAIPCSASPSCSSMCKSFVAWSTLQSLETTEDIAEPAALLTATFALGQSSLDVRYSSMLPGQLPDEALIAVLSRVLVQYCLWSWYRQQRNRYADSVPAAPGEATVVRLPNEEPRTVSVSFLAKKEPKLDDDDYTSFVRSLFQQMSVDTSDSELVEVVHGYCSEASSSTTLWLGVVPRHWVHQCNLLHRGIGVLVSKDRPIRFPCPSSWKQPDLYCHQRTATKRIFPLLYDMFVGGISLVGEDPKDTARREIAEELGLKAAFEKYDSKLSDCLIRCVVCTAYNRCVVDVFGYVVDTNTERIVWQEEEVAWGAFVPYDIVIVAADHSIRRLIATNKWPGRYLLSMPSSLTVDPNSLELARDIDSQWRQWDFVPDGLLVWESWIHAQNG
jgi:8-oxo-dGTP pyrophosphatase MutT (NUDIX family)